MKFGFQRSYETIYEVLNLASITVEKIYEKKNPSTSKGQIEKKKDDSSPMNN